MKEMKGLRNVGTVREFRPSVSVRDTIEMLITEEATRPIIGRDAELVAFAKALHYAAASSTTTVAAAAAGAQQLDTAPTDATPCDEYPSVVVVSGEGGIGRTRLMDSFVAMALRGGFRVMSGTLTMHDIEVTTGILYTRVQIG
jgi:hypothetical protein